VKMVLNQSILFLAMLLILSLNKGLPDSISMVFFNDVGNGNGLSVRRSGRKFYLETSTEK